MSTERTNTPEQGTPLPEVLPEHREQAARMNESYRDDRPTTVLPGSHGMISGTAINDWVDEHGDPIYGRAEPAEQDETGEIPAAPVV